MDVLHISGFYCSLIRNKELLSVFCQAWVGGYFDGDPAASRQVYLPPRVSLFFSCHDLIYACKNVFLSGLMWIDLKKKKKTCRQINAL